MKREFIFINQSAGTLFLELVEDVSGQIEQLYLLTGTKVNKDIPHVRIMKVPSYNKSSIIKRVWSWLFFSVVAVKEIMRIKRDVPILVVSNPPVLLWLVCLVNVIRKQPYIVLVYDIYPDLLMGLRVLGPANPLLHFWRLLSRVAYNRAKYVITLGHFMAGSLERYLDFKRKRQQLKVIPTWVDCEHFSPVDKENNHFAIKHRQQLKLTVMYSGNIGFSHDIRILIDVAKRLRSQSTFHFLIIGDGFHKSMLIEKALALKLDNVTFLSFQDEEMFPLSLATADVAVISIGRGVEKLMMPSKTYYAMAAGSALLGLSVESNDLSDVIARYECGVNVLPDDVEGAVAALEHFLLDRDYLLRCRKNSREAAIKYFSRKRNTGQFCKLLDTI